MRTIAIAFLLCACGTASSSDDSGDKAKSPVTQKGSGDPYAYAVNADTDLPACDAASMSRLVYVLNTKQFKVCNGASWDGVEVGTRLTRKVDCIGSEYVNSTFTAGFTLSVLLFSSGDAWVRFPDSIDGLFAASQPEASGTITVRVTEHSTTYNRWEISKVGDWQSLNAICRWWFDPAPAPGTPRVLERTFSPSSISCTVKNL